MKPGTELKLLQGANFRAKIAMAKKLHKDMQEEALRAEHTGPCISRKDLIAEYEKRLNKRGKR